MRRLKAWWAAKVSRTADPAWRLYRAVAAAAVDPARLQAFGLDDTPENRFELLALHLAAAWARLGVGGPDLRRMRRGLGEAFVADMDASLRDMGAGDLGVGKRVKALTERLYGRLAAYAPALAAGADAAGVADALRRNLYKDGAPGDSAVVERAVSAVCALGEAWRLLPDAPISTGEGPRP